MHDSTAARNIRLDHIMEENCSFDGIMNVICVSVMILDHFNVDRSFILYLDAGFAMGHSMVTPFRRTQRQSAEQAAWNR